MVLFWL